MIKNMSFTQAAGVEDATGFWASLLPYALHVFERELLHLDQAFGRASTIEELSIAMGIPREEYLSLLDNMYPLPLVGYPSLPSDNVRHAQGHLGLGMGLEHLSDPLQRGALREYFHDSIKFLPKQEQIVIVSYYYDNLRSSQIATLLNQQESTIRQLHSQGMIRIRAKKPDFKVATP